MSEKLVKQPPKKIKKLSATAKPAALEFARVPRTALGKPVETRSC